MHHAEMHEFKISACVHACIYTCMHPSDHPSTCMFHTSSSLTSAFMQCIHALFKRTSIHLFAQKNEQAPF